MNVNHSKYQRHCDLIIFQDPITKKGYGILKGLANSWQFIDSNQKVLNPDLRDNATKTEEELINLFLSTKGKLCSIDCGIEEYDPFPMDTKGSLKLLSKVNEQNGAMTYYYQMGKDVVRLVVFKQPDNYTTYRVSIWDRDVPILNVKRTESKFVKELITFAQKQFTTNTNNSVCAVLN